MEVSASARLRCPIKPEEHVRIDTSAEHQNAMSPTPNIRFPTTEKVLSYVARLGTIALVKDE